MSVAAPTVVTVEEWMALPDDGIRRRLHNGELIEEGPYSPQSEAAGMTLRNRYHSIAMSDIAAELVFWRRSLPKPWGNVVSGEAAVLFDDDADAVGVDVAYVQPELMLKQTDENTVIVGVPTLIVEILSPSTTVKALDDRRKVFAKYAVPVVWVVDPEDRTVTVYRHGQKPTMVNDVEELDGDPELPGFKVPVARLFE